MSKTNYSTFQSILGSLSIEFFRLSKVLNSVITLIDVFETVRVNSYFAKYVDFLCHSLLKFTCFCGVSFPLESGIFTLKPAFMVKVQVRSVTICSSSKARRKNLRVFRAPYFLAPFFLSVFRQFLFCLDCCIKFCYFISVVRNQQLFDNFRQV